MDSPRLMIAVDATFVREENNYMIIILGGGQ
jgi:hypothetical protein